MKKISFAVLVLSSVIFLYGCYESEIPLSKYPQSKVDERLLGSWTSITDGAEFDVKTYLIVQKFNENEYLIAWKEGGDDDSNIKRGFNTKFNNINIMNLQDIIDPEDGERTYTFSKYEINEKGHLVVGILSEDYANLDKMKFKSSKELYNYVKKNISKNGLFEDSLEFELTDDFGLEVDLYDDCICNEEQSAKFESALSKKK